MMLNLGFLLLTLFSQTFAIASLDKVYVHGKNINPLLSLIQKSKSSIDIEIYSMKNQKILDALREAAKRGVKVRIVQEPTPYQETCLIFESPTQSDSERCKGLKSFVVEMRALGAEYVPFSKELCGQAGRACVDHSKTVLVDGKFALISTGNFNTSNFCDESESPKGCNRDYSVVTNDPDVIQTIGRIFDHDVKGKPFDLPKILKAKGAKRLTVSPHSLAPLVSFIRSAKKSIDVETQYIKDATLRSELVAAAKRGVRVQTMVVSVCAFTAPEKPESQDAEQWQSIYSEFERAGIRSKAFNGSIPVSGYNGYLHAKAILVDGKRAWVGSVNGSTQSLTLNREFGIFSDDPNVVEPLRKTIEKDFNHPLSTTWQESLTCKNDVPRN